MNAIKYFKTSKGGKELIFVIIGSILTPIKCGIFSGRVIFLPESILSISGIIEVKDIEFKIM